MCELLGMSSSRPATVSLSLMRLAEHGGLSGPHRDGWGVGYYEDLDVRLIKEAEAAADSAWVRFLESYALRSPIVIGHIRKATMGARAYRNTQPFARELGGRMHLFAHNGWLPAIGDTPVLRPQRFRPVGETDSEQAFCALLDRMGKLWQGADAIPALDARFTQVSAFAHALRMLGPANFLYSDGDALFAHGDRRKHADSGRVAAPGLVLQQRWCPQGEQGFATEGLEVAGAEQSLALVASVPLSDEPWRPLAEGELVAIVQGRLVMRGRVTDDAPA